MPYALQLYTPPISCVWRYFWMVKKMMFLRVIQGLKLICSGNNIGALLRSFLWSFNDISSCECYFANLAINAQLLMVYSICKLHIELLWSLGCKEQLSWINFGQLDNNWRRTLRLSFVPSFSTKSGKFPTSQMWHFTILLLEKPYVKGIWIAIELFSWWF